MCFRSIRTPTTVSCCSWVYRTKPPQFLIIKPRSIIIPIQAQVLIEFFAVVKIVIGGGGHSIMTHTEGVVITFLYDLRRTVIIRICEDDAVLPEWSWRLYSYCLRIEKKNPDFGVSGFFYLQI